APESGTLPWSACDCGANRGLRLLRTLRARRRVCCAQDNHSESKGDAEIYSRGGRRQMKLDPSEKDILASVEKGEWRSVRGLKEERKRYSGYAAATFRKDRRVNIRISGKDLDARQKRALEEGLPYQTLISSLIH